MEYNEVLGGVCKASTQPLSAANMNSGEKERQVRRGVSKTAAIRSAHLVRPCNSQAGKYVAAFI